MSACITDVEYRLLLSILSTNIVEQSKLPLELVTLSEQGKLPVESFAFSEQACSPRGGEQAETRRAQSSRSGLRPACDFSLPLAQLLRTLGDSCTMKATVEATVEVKHAQLQLLLEQPDGKPPVALTCVGLSDYFISYHATEQRNMFVSIHMPSVSIEDLRPGVAAEHSLVLSTADVGAVQPICNSQDRHNHASGDEGEAPPWDKDAAPLTPSLMVFEYRAVRGRESEPDDPALTQALRMRMQKPTMVVDLRFFMTVLNFVAPQPMLQGAVLRKFSSRELFLGPGAVPREFSSRELFLGPEPYQMDEDLWLSPEFRVLADAPGTSHFLLDGCGCSLVLPPHIPSSEMLPLIMVGADKSLELRNVTILNSDSLASCLSLAPGARLIARAEDGVSMVLACSPETDTTLALRARSSRASLAANSASGLVPDGLGASSPSHASMAANSTTTSVPLGPSARRASLPLRGVSMTAPSMTDAAAPAPASGVALHVHLDALGVNLHVVDSLSNAPASSDTRDINGGKAAISRAGSNMSMGVLGSMGRQPSRASLPIASTMKWMKSSRLGPASDVPWTKSSRLGPASAVPASMQALHRLVLSMDLSASFQSETGSQLAAASIRGLTIKTHSYSMARSSLLPGPVLIVLKANACDPIVVQSSVLDPCDVSVSFKSPRSKANACDPFVVQSSVLDPCAVSVSFKESPDKVESSLDLSDISMKLSPYESPDKVEFSLDLSDISMKLSPYESPDKVEFSLDLSDISMKLSPDVMNHLLKLQNAVAMPLVLPPQDQPLSRCSKFEQLWSSAQSESSFGYATLGQGGVESMAEFRGVTLWRPQPPSGYIILGDMPVAGSNQPTHQVVTVAINSGLVAYPLGYVLVWEGEEVALWRPTPPAGYVAMGCVATASPDTPPSTKLVGCLHKRCVVEARVGDCLLLSSDGNLWCVQNSCSTLQVSAPEVHLPEVAMYDLRSPLGVPPVAATSDATLLEAAAGITNPASIKALDASDFRSTLDDTPPDAGAGADAVTGEQPLSGLTPAPAANLAEEQPVYPLSLLAQKRFLEHRKEIITSVTSRRHIATTVEFQLLWWDKHSAQPSLTQVSFWRPKPPPGYVSLGDCMVTEVIFWLLTPPGYERLPGRTAWSPDVNWPPHTGSLVFNGCNPGQSLDNGNPPQLAKPIGFVQSWLCACQHGGGTGPAATLDQCDALCTRRHGVLQHVVSHRPQLDPPALPPAQRTLCCVPLTIVGVHLTFIISVQSEPTATSSGKSRSGKGSGGTLEAWSVRLNDDADDKEEPEGPKKKAAHKPMDMSVSSGQVVVLLRDNMSQPIMELGAQNIKMIVGCQTPGVFRGYVFVTASVWSYNALISSWEPVVEPWQVSPAALDPSAHAACEGVAPSTWLSNRDTSSRPPPSRPNTHSRQCEGVAPGTWLKLTSTQGYVHVTIAHSACQNVIASAQEWAAALGDSDSTYPRSMPMVGADSAATMLGLCENTLGIPCDMLLDYGDHQEIVRLPPGERIPVNQPQVQAPAGYLASAAARGVERSSSSGRGGSGRSKGGEANAAHVTFPNSLRLLVDVLRCTAASSAPQPQGRGGSGKSVALISHSDGTNKVSHSEAPTRYSAVVYNYHILITTGINALIPITTAIIPGLPFQRHQPSYSHHHWDAFLRGIITLISITTLTTAGLPFRRHQPGTRLSPILAAATRYSAISHSEAPTRNLAVSHSNGTNQISHSQGTNQVLGSKQPAGGPPVGAVKSDPPSCLLDNELKISHSDSINQVLGSKQPAGGPPVGAVKSDPPSCLLYDELKISHSDGTNEVLGSEQPAGGPPVGAVSSDPPSCLLDDELKVLIKIRGRLSALMPESAWGVATRSVAPSPSSKGGRSVAEWHERFVVRLPEVLSEALLLPHIAGSEETNQFAGSPLQFEFQLFSGSKEGMLLDLDVLPPPKNSESNDAPEPVNPQAAVATLQARLSFDPHQMDASWRAALLQRKGASSTKTLGRRALRLVGQGDRWAPFGVKALMGQGRGNLSEVVPIPAGKGVAMESGVNADGQRVDVLRSLCVLSNSSSLPLEVSLVFNSNDVDWTVVPTVANRDGSVSEAAVVEERAVKSWSDANQNPRISWSHANLNSAERHRYNRRQGQDKGSMGFPLIPLPPNWEWEGSWHVEKHGHVDKDGWAYASAWEKLDYPFAPGCGAQKSSHMLRRRRWTRRRRLLSESEAAAAIAASTAGSLFAMGECENEGGIVRRTLGYVMPGDRLPLPMGWDTGNCDLQASASDATRAARAPAARARADASERAPRPLARRSLALVSSRARARSSALPPFFVAPAALIPNNTDVPGGEIYADVDTPLQRQDSGAFNWSKGLSLDTMAEEAKADTFLVQSRNVGGSPTSDFTSANRPPPGTSEQHPAEGQLVETYPGSTQASMLAMQPLLMSDCDPLVSAQGMDNVSDWHVDVRPPLKVHNAMPVVSHFIVWERPSSSNSLKLRQRGRIAAGDTAHVYTADMREQVLLSFWPDGCEYSESEPIIISEGISANTSGVTNPPWLPDSFRCSYVNSAASLQIPPSYPSASAAHMCHLSSSQIPPGYPTASAAHTSPLVTRQLPLLTREQCSFLTDPPLLPVSFCYSYVPFAFLADPPSLPDSFRCSYVNSAASTQLRVYLRRIMDLSSCPDIKSDENKSMAQKVGRGTPLLIRIFVPLWVVNATQLPINIGVVALESEQTHSSFMEGSSDGSTSAPHVAPRPVGAPGAFTSSPKPTSGSITILPRSMELLSWSLFSDTHYGIALSMMGSRWSAPLSLPGAQGMVGGGHGSWRQWQLRQQQPGFQNSLVLRLDVHMVVSNRTGYNLQLIQPESGSSSGGKPKSTPSSDPSGLNRGASETMDPYAHRWKQAATFNLPAGAVGTPLHWAPTVSRRLLCLSLPGITDASLPVAPDASKMSMSQAAAVAQAAAKARSVALETQTAAGSESSACEGGGQLGWYATGDAPATASTSYLPDQKAASMHRQVSSRGGGWLLWSEPFRNGVPRVALRCSGTPVYCMGEVGSIPDDDPITRRDSGGGTLTPPYGEAVEAARKVFMKYALSAAAPGLTGPSFVRVAKETEAGPGAVEAARKVFMKYALSAAAPGLTGPSFVRVAKETEAGPLEFLAVVVHLSISIRVTGCLHLEFLAVVVHLSISIRVTGCLHLVMHTIGGEAQQLIQNLTSHPLRFRENGYARQYTLDGASLEVELKDAAPATLEQQLDAASDSDIPVVLSFDPEMEGGASGGTRSSSKTRNGGAGAASGTGSAISTVIKLGMPAEECLAQVTDVLEVTMCPGGLSHVQGVQYVKTLAKLRNIQIDDMLFNSPHPVLALPVDANRADSASGDLMFLMQVSEPNRRRGVMCMPSIVLRALPLRLSLSEALLWRLYSFGDTLQSALSRSVLDSSTAGNLQRSDPANGSVAHTTTKQVSADLPLQVDLLNVEDLNLRLSFKPNASVRPRYFSQFMSLGMDFANLEDLPLTLPGIEAHQVREQRSMLISQAVNRLQQRIFSIALSVLKNYGVMGATSKILAAASHGITSLVDNSNSQAVQVGNIGDGVLEGGKAFAKGIFHGAKGIVAKPIKGASDGGFQGFFSGLGKGFIGAATAPVSGALAAASKVTEGMDATYSTMRSFVSSAPRRSGRKRLPRHFTGDRILEPFNLDMALGQALLQSACYPVSNSIHGMVSSSVGKLSRTESSMDPDQGPAFNLDLYEHHTVLPNKLVLMTTNIRLCMLLAPEFVVLQQLVGLYEHHTVPPNRLVLMTTIMGLCMLLAPEFVALQQLVGLYEHHTVLPSRLVLMTTNMRLCMLLAPEFVALQQLVGLYELHTVPPNRLVLMTTNMRLCMLLAPEFVALQQLVGLYEHHTVLPNKLVLMTTNMRLCMLLAPEFVALQQLVLTGELTHVTDVPGGTIVWQLPWEDLLTVDLAWHKQQPGIPPDGLIIHRKRRGEKDGAIVYDVRCQVNGLIIHRKRRGEKDGAILYDVRCQAAELHPIIQSCRHRFFVKPRQEIISWKEQQIIPSRTFEGQARPDTMLSAEWKLVWYSSKQLGPRTSLSAKGGAVVGGLLGGGKSSVSIWRPTGVPGYAMLGDVAVIGTEPPPRPVRMYKDILNSDTVLRALLLRDCSQPPFTLWKPVPPKGYCELGCVAWPDIEEPPLDLVRCMRRDLVTEALTYDAPIWSGASSDNSYWRCSIWEVDNHAGTFLATKTEQRPHRSVSRAPLY
eukprot:gene25166-10797_t